MARTIASSVDIDAAAGRVWALLTDFGSFPEWNPFIRYAEGTLAPGARLKLRLRLFDGRSVALRPRLISVVPERELAWRARIGLPGVLDVDRRFRIEPRDGGGVRFEQSEVATGVMAPLLDLGLDERIRTGYRDLERALKARAEAG